MMSKLSEEAEEQVLLPTVPYLLSVDFWFWVVTKKQDKQSMVRIRNAKVDLIFRLSTKLFCH